MPAGVDPARRDAVDAHVRRQRHGQRMRQRHQPALARRVGQRVGLRHVRARRGDGDDGAARPPEVGGGGLGQQERGGQVGRQHPVPVLERGLGQRRRILPMPGIGDDGIDAAEAARATATRRSTSASLPTSHCDSRRRRSRPRPRSRASPSMSAQRHLPALPRQMPRHGGADAARRAGDDGRALCRFAHATDQIRPEPSNRRPRAKAAASPSPVSDRGPTTLVLAKRSLQAR